MCMKENYTPEERRIVMEIKEILQNQESQDAMKQDDITLIETGSKRHYG